MSEVLPEDSFEAAAAEAAAIGPQLCVILSLADAGPSEDLSSVRWEVALLICRKQPIKAAGVIPCNSELSGFMRVHVWSPVLVRVSPLLLLPPPHRRPHCHHCELVITMDHCHES